MLMGVGDELGEHDLAHLGLDALGTVEGAMEASGGLDLDEEMDEEDEDEDEDEDADEDDGDEDENDE
ncbi:MAG: hypothetical protein M5R36_15290 [Deltaproteobacteria bacterium]|nr:hypothetical protein [Deltaproteobacteria bacterium]